VDLPQNNKNIMVRQRNEHGNHEKNQNGERDHYYCKKRKLQYLGHVMRGEKYHLLQLIMQGKI